jgi:hypothetical protein
MAQTIVHNLLTQTVKEFGVSTAEQKTSSKIEASGYYYYNRDIQTVMWNFSQNFNGVCTIQASLMKDPQQDADWFDAFVITENMNKTGYHNLVGNFVWLRARVSNWTDGVINTVSVCY